MNQVRHITKKISRRLFCTSTDTENIFTQLTERSLMKISGNESSQFLQGLITNDMNHIENGMGCMYTMFLNTKGRVLYDAIIYKTEEQNAFIIECDANGLDVLFKHIKMYRVRRKIDLEKLTEQFNVYALFRSQEIVNGNTNGSNSKSKLEGMIVPCTKLNETVPANANSVKIYRDLFIYQDPRVSSLGSRVIAPKNTDASVQISEITQISNNPLKFNTYRQLRYALGVGEGTNDLPPANCFPLEANCDYLHGISFHKGCYIGQELTARTHHTGVVRKRLMPLYFVTEPTSVQDEEKIMHEGVNLGKLRGAEGGVGLGLLRVTQALEVGEFRVGDGVARTVKPHWWPVEAPKERVKVG